MCRAKGHLNFQLIMGSRIPKPDVIRTEKEKTVEFKSRFLDESQIQLKNDSSPNTSRRSSPVRTRTNRSLSLPVLSVEYLLSLLRASRVKGSEAYSQLLESQILNRKQFRLGLGQWGNQFEDWCEGLQEGYLELLDSQCRDQEHAMHQASLEVLKDFDVTEKELEESLRLYISHPEIAQALVDLNDFEPHIKIKLPMSELFQVLYFRTERAEELNNSLSLMNKQKRLQLIKCVVEDETIMRYGYDDLELSWSIKTACEDMDEVWQDRLRQLQERFAATCSKPI